MQIYKMVGVFTFFLFISGAPGSLLAAVRLNIDAPVVVVPGPTLPTDLTIRPSNNNVALGEWRGDQYLAFRSAPTHFAGDQTRIEILVSSNGGESWKSDHQIYHKTDMREPYFVNWQGRLFFYFFEAGVRPLHFEPKQTYRMEKTAEGWSEPIPMGLPGEIFWEIKPRGNWLYASTYLGNHYAMTKPGTIEARFYRSLDGFNWEPISDEGPAVYVGGVSEVSFDWDGSGKLWAVGRNEDGDRTGFGTQVFSSNDSEFGIWNSRPRSLPSRMDSPRSFTQCGEIYWVARRNTWKSPKKGMELVNRPFDLGHLDWTFGLQKLIYLAQYSLTPKRTSLYRLDPVAGVPEVVADLEGGGDTAFPSILRLDSRTLQVANYSSPMPLAKRWNWVKGQTHKIGTQILMQKIRFESECKTD